MSDLLGIGASGITVYQRALTTVSNNIANVNTDGYSRQDVLLNANTPQLVGSNYLGTGAVFDGVRRQYNGFIEQNLRNSNSDLKAQEPMVSYVNRLIDLVGGESIGLTSAMNQFFESSRNLATDSASTVQRSTFLRDADGLATRFRELDAQFEMIDTETRQSVQNDIGQINSYTTQLAAVNKQLTRHAHVEDQPAELMDQRDQLLRQLSSLTAIKTKFSDNGAVLVSVGDVIDQGVLVDGNKSFAIGLSNAQGAADSSKLQFVLDPYGTPRSLPNLLSGSIGGVQTFREQVLNPTKEALDSLATTIAREVNAIHHDGIDFEGRLGGDLFAVESNSRGAAAGIKVAISDASRVAAAGQFRVVDDPLNTGSAQASIAWTNPTYQGPTGLYGTLSQGLVPSVPQESLVLTSTHPMAALGVVSTGLSDVVISLKDPAPGQSLQVFTRDGLQLLGTSTLDATQKRLILSQEAGMEAGITSTSYDATNLNKSLLGMDLFLGARGGPQMIQQFDPNTKAVLEPTMTNAMLQGHVFALPSIGAIGAGTFKLNGVTLGALTTQDAADANRPTTQEVANWVNRYTAQTGVAASLSDTGRLVLANSPASTNAVPGFTQGPYGTAGDLTRIGTLSQPLNLSLAANTFTLNGVSLGALNNASSMTAIASWINQYQGSTQVTASVATNGALRLTSTNPDLTKDIRLGIGAAGQPSDLTKLGFDVSVNIIGAAKDDLLVFATGTSGTVDVTSQIGSTVSDVKQTIRGQSLQVKFTDATHYQVVDSSTTPGTVLAKKTFDVNAGTVSYRGLTITFASRPAAGDVFSIDGNKDGIGNNDNMLKLAELENRRLMPGELTMTEAYIEQVNQVGNMAQQASISQDALNVVYQQANEARDGLAGVSLDEEAASLVRFQQAYQANARVMQAANDLFDAILQVR